MRAMKMRYGMIGIYMLLTACGEADDVRILPLEVSAEIASEPTRATVDGTNYDKASFDLDDQISISLKNSGSSVLYKKGQSGWLPADGGEGLNTTGNQTYVATYPTTFSSIQQAQETYNGFWASNQLRSEVTATANKVSFSFAPVAAKITIVVTYDADKTPVSATVVGQGIRTNGASSETINLLRTSGSTQYRRHSYVGIIYPGTSRTYTISVNNSGETVKTYLQTAMTLTAGHNYQYNFIASNELILTSVTVKAFNDQTEEDGGSAT